MRVLIWARAQVAVPLAVALECPLLIGGISDTEAELMIERFKADPNGIMIATPAYQTGWRANVEAVTIFTEDNFIDNHAQAASRVLPPSMDCPSVDDFMDWYKARALKQAKASTYEVGVNALPSRMHRLRDARREPGGDFDVTAKADPRPVLSCYMPRQEQDEYVCKCGLRWDVNEDKPSCQRDIP